MVLHGSSFLLKFIVGLGVVNFEGGVLVVQIGELLVLDVRFFVQSDVLDLDVLLDLGDALLCIGLGCLSVLI